ncbi:AAA domain-containing protein [Prauserella shujinwangii]|uniref:AAA domain-containing protein n=2 Tax=Prauserella shujinwangii TaxID=1453103 RepID=A0A2T0LSV2_9PSEU|nr:AAA domain-containing protein [Prauserella shujinwangii]
MYSMTEDELTPAEQMNRELDHLEKVDPELQEFAKLRGIDASNLQQKVRDEEVRQAVRDYLKTITFRPPEPLGGTLGTFLAKPLPPVQYLIEGLHGDGHNTVITAKFKVGKSTMLFNLIKSLCDGVPFLGKFNVTQPVGRIVYLNYEMEERDVQRDLAKLGIENTDGMVAPVNLRGVRLPLTDDRAQEWLIEQLKGVPGGVHTLMLDTYTKALSQCGIDENDNSGVGQFLDAIDYVKNQAQVANLFMTAHMGRADHEEGEERTRGATRLNDWQDVGWIYTRRNGGPAFLAASGRRGINQEACEIQWNPETLELKATGQTRDSLNERSRRTDLREKILDAFDDDIVRLSKNQINQRVQGRKAAINSEIDTLVKAGILKGHGRDGGGPYSRSAGHSGPGTTPSAGGVDPPFPL